MRKIILFLLVLITAALYTSWTYQFPWLAEPIVFGLQDRPFVYRALVPLLSRLLWLAGLPANVALTVIVLLSAIGLLYALYYLFIFRQN